METPEIAASCKRLPYKDLYDHYTNYSFFGGLMEFYFDPLDNQKRAERINQGYVVNKQFEQIVKWHTPENRLHFRVFDHIRVIEEALSGVFTVDNDEFNLVWRRFLKEFMMGSVYVIYSDSFRKYELGLAAKLAEERHQDPYDRIERSAPNSNFRILKRVSDSQGNWRWDAVLSQVENVTVDRETLSVKDNEPMPMPIRFSFNEGFMFIRLFEIFRRFEAAKQVYYKLFLSICTVGEITAPDYEGIYNKMSQFESPEVFTATMSGEDSTATTVEDLKLVDKSQNLTELYNQIRQDLMDSLGEIGLGVDDATKKERITVGENTRALQPTINFQNTILNELKLVALRIKYHFNVDMQFKNQSEQREQRMSNLNQSKFNKYDFS